MKYVHVCVCFIYMYGVGICSVHICVYVSVGTIALKLTPTPTQFQPSYLLSWHSCVHGTYRKHHRIIQVSVPTNAWKFHFLGEKLLVALPEKSLSLEMKCEFSRLDPGKMEGLVGRV